MDESLTQRRRVWDEALRGVTTVARDEYPSLEGLTVPGEEAPANSVPAAAVIQRVRALSGITGRKGRVGGLLSVW